MGSGRRPGRHRTSRRHRLRGRRRWPRGGRRRHDRLRVPGQQRRFGMAGDTERLSVECGIISVRTWPGEVTVGVAYQGQGGVSERIEVVIPDTSRVQGYQYQAAPFGGAVAAPAAYTVIIGPQYVTSYDNASGKVRWRLPIGNVAQSWQIDGQYLYMAESAGGGA